MANQVGGYTDTEFQLREEIYKLPAVCDPDSADQRGIEDYINLKVRHNAELDEIYDANCSKIIFCLRQNEEDFYRALDYIDESKKEARLDQDS